MSAVLGNASEYVRWDFVEVTRIGREWYVKNRDLRHFIGNILQLRGSEQILDLGCGIGTLTKIVAPLLKSGGQVIGIDTDATLVEYGNAHWARKPNLHLRVGDANCIPYDPDTFNVVASMGLLEWVQDPGLAFSEMTRVVTIPGKIMVVHLDTKELTYYPCSKRFKTFYNDLHKAYQRIGGDPDLLKFIELCRKWQIPSEKFTYTYEYENEINEKLINFLQGQINAVVPNERRIDELADFYHQFLRYMGYTWKEVREVVATEQSPEHNYKLYRAHEGEMFHRRLKTEVYLIKLDKNHQYDGDHVISEQSIL